YVVPACPGSIRVEDSAEYSAAASLPGSPRALPLRAFVLWPAPRDGHAAMKSLVISVDLGAPDYAAHAEEFLMLASGAGADIVEVLTARRSRPDAAGFIGSGKIEEAAALVKATGAE